MMKACLVGNRSVLSAMLSSIVICFASLSIESVLALRYVNKMLLRRILSCKGLFVKLVEISCFVCGDEGFR